MSFPSHERVPYATPKIQDHVSPPPPSYEGPRSQSYSLDITQRFERKLVEYNASNNIIKRWLFEIICVSISAVCMVSIAITLLCLDSKLYNNSSVLLTFVTILSKVAAAALIIPISEAIGQLKWTWFQGKSSKDAYDFEIFDKASRGAWGSVLLLFRTRCQSLAAFGAVLTLLLLAIDTFFQQVTDASTNWQMMIQNGSIPRSVRYEPSIAARSISTTEISTKEVNVDLASALYPLFHTQAVDTYEKSGKTTSAHVPVSCPSGNCTWAPYNTLAVCSACEDVSDLLEYACLTAAMDWISYPPITNGTRSYPNGTARGFFLNSTSENPILMSGYEVGNTSNSYGTTLLMRILPLITNNVRHRKWGGSINFKHISNPIEDAIIVSAANGTTDSVHQGQRPVAHECILTWCVQKIQSSYSMGNYDERIIKTIVNTTDTGFGWINIPVSDSLVRVDFRANISIYPPGPENGTEFGVSNNTFYDTVDLFDQIFPSIITQSNTSAYLRTQYDMFENAVYAHRRSSPWLEPINVTSHMEKIAETITKVIRSDLNSNEFIPGPAFTQETIIMIHWAWLIFPVMMLLLSGFFLIATMMKTSQSRHSEIGNWKTSAMPTLVYGLPKEMQSSFTSSLHPKDAFSEDGKKVRIRLSPKQGWRVSGYTGMSPSRASRSGGRAPPGWI